MTYYVSSGTLNLTKPKPTVLMLPCSRLLNSTGQHPLLVLTAPKSVSTAGRERTDSD